MNGGSGGAASTKPRPSHTSARRAISEADIIQIDGGLLYALSKSGTASIVDISTPGELALLGQTTLAGEPFEMYRLGEFLVTMSNGAIAPDGSPNQTRSVGDLGVGALVTVLDVRDPELPAEVATLRVPGEIADSRIVGNVLYVASHEDGACFQCGVRERTVVTTFNIANPIAIKLIEQVSFETNEPGTDNTVWGASWKRSIFVTEKRLYVGGHTNVGATQAGIINEGIIDVLDISDPGGRLKIGARLAVAGPILSRWQLDEHQGVLRVVSQRGSAQVTNGVGAPEVDTFQVESAQSFAPLGHLTMRLPRQEGLRAVRFDGARAYAITFARTDPLFVIDLADPAAPRQRGELVIPGFMFHLEPRGDRIIGLGVDGTDPNGSLNVSLFDVADAGRPSMLSRVSFATPYLNENYAIMNEVAEDQDRIQKAFRVLDGGLVVVPFSQPRSYYETNNGCDNVGGGIQLVEWKGDTLGKRALLPVPGNPRRAFDHDQQIIGVSDSNVRSFALDNLDVAHQTADVVIGTCVPDPLDYTGGGVNEGWGGERSPPLACSAAPGVGAWWSPLALFAIFLAARRRPSARKQPVPGAGLEPAGRFRGRGF